VSRFSDSERAKIRAEASATIARVDRILANQPSHDENIVAVAEPAVDWHPEDPLAKWKREGAASDAARLAYKRHLAAIADSQRQRTLAYQVELARAAAPVTIGGQHDAEIFAGFEEVAKTFHHVLDRVEALERRLNQIETNAKVFSQPEKTQTERGDGLRYSTRIQ
jgi:hypothetical protein